MSLLLAPPPVVEIPADAIPQVVGWVRKQDAEVLEKSIFSAKVPVYGRDSAPGSEEGPRVPLYRLDKISEYCALKARATRSAWTPPARGHVGLPDEGIEALAEHPNWDVLSGGGSHLVQLVLESAYLKVQGGDYPVPEQESADIQLLPTAPAGHLRAKFVRQEGEGLRDWAIQVQYGEGVSEDTAALLALFFTESRMDTVYSVISQPPGDNPVERSFLAEALRRRLDPATLRFEIRCPGAGKPLPKVLRSIQITPGKLKARWARYEDDTADLCTSWAQPCSRRDSAMLTFFLNANVCFPQRRDIPRPFPGKMSLVADLEAAGLDKRTLKLDIGHRDLAANSKV